MSVLNLQQPTLKHNMVQPETTLRNLVCNEDLTVTKYNQYQHSLSFCPTSAAADLPQPEDKLIIIPCFFCIISGTKWRSTFAVPLIFVSTTVSNSSAGTFHVLLFLFIVPALFTAAISQQLDFWRNHILCILEWNYKYVISQSTLRKKSDYFHIVPDGLKCTFVEQKVQQTYDIRNLLPFHNSLCQFTHAAVRPLQRSTGRILKNRNYFNIGSK